MNRSSLSELDAHGSAETDLRYSERNDVLFIGCAGIGLGGEDMRHAAVGERTGDKSAVPKICFAGRAFDEILV